MVVPVALATIAATGSIVTSIKSAWELSRMARKKLEQKEAQDEAPYVFRKLRKAYHNELMTDAEYEVWYERFLAAKVDKDLPGLLRIKAHLRILESGVPSIGMSKNSRYPSSHSSSSSRSSPTASPRSYRDDDRHVGRRHSVSYAPSPPPYREMPWPPSAGSIEYFPERGGQRQQGARPEQFIRLQRQATSTYTPPNTTGYASSNISPRMMAVKPKRSSSVREESSSSRGRSRRYAEESEEDDWYDEKRPARGRSMKRN